MEESLDVPGLIRRVRRVADLSQRDLAEALGVGQAVVARWETGECEPSLTLFGRLLELAGWGLGVVDEAGEPVAPMGPGACRDQGRRRYPAHLDVHDAEDPSTGVWTPRVLRRRGRNARRARDGLVPSDHPSMTDLLRARRERIRRRGEALSARMSALRARRVLTDAPDCVCEAACWVSAGCAAGCACRCEPEVGPSVLPEERGARITCL